MFERIKRLTGAPGRAASRDYVCQSCDAGYEVQRQVCTECGGYHIERSDW